MTARPDRPDAAARAGIDPDVAGAHVAHAEMISAHEERLAERRASAIAAGRRRGGLPGAAMAGAMLVVSDIVEGRPKEDTPVTVEASSDPHDLERDGVDVTVGGVDVSAPPLERLAPVVDGRARRR
jgi:uncharacterized Ntn-hydrolase superfamily protein